MAGFSRTRIPQKRRAATRSQALDERYDLVAPGFRLNKIGLAFMLKKAVLVFGQARNNLFLHLARGFPQSGHEPSSPSWDCKPAGNAIIAFVRAHVNVVLRQGRLKISDDAGMPFFRVRIKSSWVIFISAIIVRRRRDFIHGCWGVLPAAAPIVFDRARPFRQKESIVESRETRINVHAIVV